MLGVEGWAVEVAGGAVLPLHHETRRLAGDDLRDDQARRRRVLVGELGASPQVPLDRGVTAEDLDRGDLAQTLNVCAVAALRLVDDLNVEAGTSAVVLGNDDLACRVGGAERRGERAASQAHEGRLVRVQ